MVKLTPGQSVKTEREGQWRQTRVLQVDASLVRVSVFCMYYSLNRGKVPSKLMVAPPVAQRVSEVVKYNPTRAYQSWSWKLNHFENIIDSLEVM